MALENAYLENTFQTVQGHLREVCNGEKCTLHNRSKHPYRSWQQLWQGGKMWRICPKHNERVLDPDEVNHQNTWASMHTCSQCAAGIEDPNDIPVYIQKLIAENLATGFGVQP